MCAQYWNLNVPDYLCPVCGKKGDWEFQTHFGGWSGSCVNHYSLGEKVAELGDLSGTIGPGGIDDDFIADCPHCGEFLNFAATIKDGAVVALAVKPTLTFVGGSTTTNSENTQSGQRE